MHRADDTTFVNHLGQFREQLAYVDAALPVPVEPERRAQENSIRVRKPQAVGNGLTGVLREHRLGSQRVCLGWTTVQIKVCDAVRACGKMRRLGLKGTRSPAGLTQQMSQGQHAKTVAHSLKKLPTSHWRPHFTYRN